MKLGLLHTIIREDEKKLIAACEQEGIDLVRLDLRNMQFVLGEPLADDIRSCDVVLDRALAFSKALYAAEFLQAGGVKVINPPDLVANCGDKIKTSLLLASHNIPTPKTIVALTSATALDAIETIGYPVVLKPAIGSWGRLLAKINDRDSAEAVLEHKATLGSYHHDVYYIQEYIEKPGRDIRVVVVGKKAIAAMYRTSEHWITNAARSGEPEPCPLTPELLDIVDKVTAVLGEGLLGIDLFEHQGKLCIGEVNAGVEFKAISRVTDIDIALEIIRYACKSVQQS